MTAAPRPTPLNDERTSPGATEARGARWPLALILPVVALQVLAIASLALGRDTLVLRDVLATHLPMKQAQAQALARGELPELDVHRGGGQPLLGNPNGAPFHPDNALYLLAPAGWALNAHFWIHFLLAPWSFAWLARRLGSGRAASWVGGAVYATSGWFLSQMTYYNLVGGAALTPAFVAACLAARDEATRGRRWATVAGLLWALVLVAGEPTLAALAVVAAIVALVFVPRGGAGEPSAVARPRCAVWAVPLALGLLFGSAVAAPQLVELARALPTSARGVHGFDVEARTLSSWDPRQALEQLVPLAFGRIDRGGAGAFWGFRFHTGTLPFFLSLYPGLLPLALAAAAGRARARGGGFAWIVLALGVLVALGRFDPLLWPVLGLEAGSFLRFPIKAWILVALGLGVLAAAGWDRAVTAGEDRAASRARRALVVLAAALAVVAALSLAGASSLHAWMQRALPPGAPPALVDGEPRRWALVATLLVAIAAALAAALRWAGARPAAAVVALALHVGAQLALLAPATLVRDRTTTLFRAPPMAGALRPGVRLVHGSMNRLFGAPPRRPPPDGDKRWIGRQEAVAAFPFAGVPRGWRYELAMSPEGLDSFLTRLAGSAVKTLDDRARVRLLQVWGIEALLLERPLAGGVPGARLVESAEGPLAPVYVYALDGATPLVRRVAGARSAADPRAARDALLDPTFDPRVEVVLAGGVSAPPGAGQVIVAVEGDERIALSTSDARPGWVVVERTWQPQWKAHVDERDAAVVPADLHRLAVAVPAGAHRVELWVDRRPLGRALGAAFAGLLGLVALAMGRAARPATLPRA